MRENCLLAAGLRIWLNWILGWAIMLKDTSFGVDLLTGGRWGQGREAGFWASIKRKSRAVVGLCEGVWACGLRGAITYIGYKMFVQKCHLSQPIFQSTEERQEGSFHTWGKVGSWRREAS